MSERPSDDVANELCDLVAERIALGEPLAEAADHADGCERCRAARALTAQLARPAASIEPGMGFAARMTAGAQHRLVVRRKRRIATGAVAAAAASVLGVFAFAHVMHGSDDEVAVPTQTAPSPTNLAAMAQPSPTLDANPEPAAHVDPDVRALVRLADIDRDLRPAVSWKSVYKPVRPYRAVVQGVKP